MYGSEKVLATAFAVLIRALRSVLFVVVLVASRVLVPVLRFIATAGVVVFCFCALARRDQITPMCSGAALAFGAVALELALDMAVRVLAPSDVVVISEM